MTEAQLLSQSIQNFRECNGKMAVPITFLGRAERESGKFYNRFYISTHNAVYSLLNSNDGELHYYEILGKIRGGKVDWKEKYQRILIWEVYPK